MALVYILENHHGKHYIGITSLSPETRLAKHNRGEVYSTRFGKPWTLIYREKHISIKVARTREKQIKSWHGGNAFKKLVRRAVGSANGRQTGSEPVNPGSNPGPTALRIEKNLAG